jgi:fumarate hydratase class II
MHNFVCHTPLHSFKLLETSIKLLCKTMTQLQSLQVVERQPTNEISNNHLIQTYRMVGTVNHSIGCSNATKILAQTL